MNWDPLSYKEIERMTIEYNNIKLLHKSKRFIMNTEAIEHNTNTLKNLGCNTKKSDSTKKCYLTKIEKKKKDI